MDPTKRKGRPLSGNGNRGQRLDEICITFAAFASAFFIGNAIGIVFATLFKEVLK